MLKRLPRGRNGGRPPKYTANNQPVQTNLYIPASDFENFCELVPETAARNELATGWVRGYVTARGETDRLLAQSPTALKLLACLEATDAPEELRDELESLIVRRDSDEVKIAEGVAQVGESFIV